MVGNVCGLDLADVALRRVAVPRLVGLLRVAVPLGREYAPSPELFERGAEAAYPREQINEIEWKRVRAGGFL